MTRGSASGRRNTGEFLACGSPPGMVWPPRPEFFDPRPWDLAPSFPWQSSRARNTCKVSTQNLPGTISQIECELKRTKHSVAPTLTRQPNRTASIFADFRKPLFRRLRRNLWKEKGILEARGGIEPPIKVLQTFALPLGDRAAEILVSSQEIIASHLSRCQRHPLQRVLLLAPDLRPDINNSGCKLL